MINIRRGSLIMCNLGKREGSCQSGIRPAIVVQNDTGNRFSTTTMIIPITSKEKNKLPVHTYLKHDYKLAKKGDTLMAEQLTVIDKSQILEVGDTVNLEDLKELDKCVLIQLSLLKSAMAFSG